MMVVGHLNTLLEAMKQGHTERLTQFLAFSSRFHLYSLRNQELIYLQCPEATQVASYKEWKEEGYQVRKMDKAKEERRTMSLHTQVYADNPALCLHRPGYGIPYRLLCNDVQREGAKPSPDLAFGLFCYVPLHNIWYGIRFGAASTLIVECHVSPQHGSRIIEQGQGLASEGEHVACRQDTLSMYTAKKE